MSRVKCSWPTPTVKTGIERALRLASDSSSEASEVSAPSVTITRPASGRPESSSRARSSASPSFVDVPSYLSSAADPSRPADEEKRKNRRTNRSWSVFSSAASMPPQLLLHELAARLAVAVGDEHAARVVDQDAEEVLLRNGRLENQRRPDQTEQQHRDEREPQPDEHAPCRATILRSQSIGKSGGRRPRSPRPRAGRAASAGTHPARSRPAERPGADT